MTQDQSPIVLCNTCRVTPEEKTDEAGDDIVVCPSCGQSDKADEVGREVLRSAFHETVRRTSGPDTRPSANSFVSMSVKGPKSRSFRWIAGT